MWLPEFDFFRLFIGFSQNLMPPLWAIIPVKSQLLVAGTIPELTDVEKDLIEAYKTPNDIKIEFLTADLKDGLFINVCGEIDKNIRNIPSHSQTERYLTEAKELLKIRLNALRAEYFPDFPDEQIEFNFFQGVQANLNQLEENYLKQNLSDRERETVDLLIEYLKDTLFFLFHYYFAYDILTIEQIKGNFKDGNERFQEHLKTKYDHDYRLTNNASKSNPAKYCIEDRTVISKLFDIFRKYGIIEPIEFVDFLACFDLNNVPPKNLSATPQNMLIFALKRIEKINNKMALSHFGINNYDSYNSRSIGIKWISAQDEIVELLKNRPINVKSK